MRIPFASIPALCPGGTVLCVASGPSLTAADVELCREYVDATVVVNTSYRMAPWATVLYAADSRWWEMYPDAANFRGLKCSINSQKRPEFLAKFPDIQILKNTGDSGLELDPSGLRTGSNSGYQAINLAVHLLGRQPGTIILLGYDMQVGVKGETHWHGKHPKHESSNYKQWIPTFKTLIKPLAQVGIEIVNCTRRTQLTMFPQMSLEHALRLELSA